jgi:hypothetical protein
MSNLAKKIEYKLIAYLRNKLQDTMIGYEEPLTPLEAGCETHIY